MYLLTCSLLGLGLLVYQIFLYPPFEKYLGPITSSRVAAVCNQCHPFLNIKEVLQMVFLLLQCLFLKLWLQQVEGLSSDAWLIFVGTKASTGFLPTWYYLSLY
ncbi:hypothetical protein GW17_00002495 [Ensete ventricosum]|nr:hypothetical protein GW17_00002495 [Ensete ventricosum]RZR87657.1 hypothetical protein BHM03_00015111 [Ensete ventricosum]